MVQVDQGAGFHPSAGPRSGRQCLRNMHQSGGWPRLRKRTEEDADNNKLGIVFADGGQHDHETP